MVSKEGVKSRPCHVNQGPSETSFCPFVKTADERIIRAALEKRRLVDDFIEGFNAMSSEKRQAKLEAFLMGIEEDSYLKAMKAANGPSFDARIAEVSAFASRKRKVVLLMCAPPPVSRIRGTHQKGPAFGLDEAPLRPPARSFRLG